MIPLEMDDTVRNGNNDNVMVRIPAKVVSYQGRLAEQSPPGEVCGTILMRLNLTAQSAQQCNRTI